MRVVERAAGVRLAGVHAVAGCTLHVVLHLPSLPGSMDGNAHEVETAVQPSAVYAASSVL